MAAALSAFHLRIPVVHVEAGLRTGGLNLTPFPEELNRQVISTHRRPALRADLGEPGEPGPREHPGQPRSSSPATPASTPFSGPRQIDVEFANPELQALHDSDSARRRRSPPTAARTGATGLSGIADGVRRLAEADPEVHFVLPVHPNPAVAETLTELLSGRDNVLLTEPLGYATFSRLLARADAGDHRLGRGSGRGAVARQAGAGHPREHRADGGGRGRHAAPGRRRPRPHLPRGRAPARRPGRLRGDGGRRKPLRRRPGRRAHRRARSSTSSSAASRRASSAPATAARRSPRPPDSTSRPASSAPPWSPPTRVRRPSAPGDGSGRSSDGRARPPVRGAAAAWAAVFYFCFAVIVAMFAWTAILFVRGSRAARHAAAGPGRRHRRASPGSSWSPP